MTGRPITSHEVHVRSGFDPRSGETLVIKTGQKLLKHILTAPLQALGDKYQCHGSSEIINGNCDVSI